MMAEADNLAAADEAVEREAALTGWKPEAEFQGKGWKPATEWIEYAHSMMPLLNATNKRVKEDNARLAREVAQLKTLVATSQQVVLDLKKSYDADTVRQVAAAKKELGASLKEARADGNTEAEVQIQTEITKLAAAEVEAERAAKIVPIRQEGYKAADDPHLQAWAADNAWFEVDTKKSRRALAIAADIKEDNPSIVGAAFYKELDKRIAAEIDGTTARPVASKVEGGGTSGEAAGGGGAKRGFASLPADARSASKEFERELVGEGKPYKTLKDYQTYYATEYYRNEDKQR